MRIILSTIVDNLVKIILSTIVDNLVRVILSVATHQHGNAPAWPLSNRLKQVKEKD